MGDRSTFRIALRPADPYDVLRGRYFILNPEGGSIDTADLGQGNRLSAGDLEKLLDGEEAFRGDARIGFCPDGEIERICALARTDAQLPSAPVAHWSAGQVSLSRAAGTAGPEYFGSIDLGLDRFFLPDQAKLPAPENATGWELEVIDRPGQLLLPKRLWFGGKPVELR